MRKVLDTRTFSDMDELLDVLHAFQDAKKDHVLYVESDGFFAGGKAELVEEMLSDDSLVYNVNLTTDD